MNIDSLKSFTSFDQFYELYEPLTAYGTFNKNSAELISDVEELQQSYDRVEMLVLFIKNNKKEADQLAWHLKHISYLNPIGDQSLTSSDLFLIKKLLIHYKAIGKLLDENLKVEFNIYFALQNILNLLSPDGEQESFYLKSSYDENLVIIRNAILDTDQKLENLKNDHHALLMEKYDLDFRFREFIVISEDKAIRFDQDLVFKEVFDKHSLIVKPVYPKSYFELHKKKDDLIHQEGKIVQKVLTKISHHIFNHREDIASYLKRIELLDTHFAKARIAIAFNMTKPEIIKSGAPLEIINGRYLPLMKTCEQMGVSYTPLNVNPESKVMVITGSNMGGKTIMLKTVGFMQILAQMGFWVPADRFKTTIYQNLIYIGDDEQNKIDGLSSFGFEIHKLTKAWKHLENPALLLIDELGRTTNSFEAKAIISALLDRIRKYQHVSCLLSTHFFELPPFENITYYKMRGLHIEAFQNSCELTDNQTLSERIKLINSFMIYEVEKSKPENLTFDAIQIAETLGLDKNVIQLAKHYLNQK